MDHFYLIDNDLTLASELPFISSLIKEPLASPRASLPIKNQLEPEPEPQSPSIPPLHFPSSGYFSPSKTLRSQSNSTVSSPRVPSGLYISTTACYRPKSSAFGSFSVPPPIPSSVARKFQRKDSSQCSPRLSLSSRSFSSSSHVWINRSLSNPCPATPRRFASWDPSEYQVFCKDLGVSDNSLQITSNLLSSNPSPSKRSTSSFFPPSTPCATPQLSSRPNTSRLNRSSSVKSLYHSVPSSSSLSTVSNTLDLKRELSVLSCKSLNRIEKLLNCQGNRDVFVREFGFYQIFGYIISLNNLETVSQSLNILVKIFILFDCNQLVVDCPELDKFLSKILIKTLNLINSDLNTVEFMKNFDTITFVFDRMMALVKTFPCLFLTVDNQSICRLFSELITSLMELLKYKYTKNSPNFSPRRVFNPPSKKELDLIALSTFDCFGLIGQFFSTCLLSSPLLLSPFLFSSKTFDLMTSFFKIGSEMSFNHSVDRVRQSKSNLIDGFCRVVLVFAKFTQNGANFVSIPHLFSSLQSCLQFLTVFSPPSLITLLAFLSKNDESSEVLTSQFIDLIHLLGENTSTLINTKHCNLLLVALVSSISKLLKKLQLFNLINRFISGIVLIFEKFEAVLIEILVQMFKFTEFILSNNSFSFTTDVFFSLVPLFPLFFSHLLKHSSNFNCRNLFYQLLCTIVSFCNSKDLSIVFLFNSSNLLKEACRLCQLHGDSFYKELQCIVNKLN
ncbi:hypothetical protein RCL1_001656 [Eukaryota sp. TZLM3-RCL]